MAAVPHDLAAASVLVVNSFEWRLIYTEYLTFHGCAVRASRRPEQAVRLVDRREFDAVVADLRFADSRWTGSGFIRFVRARRPLANIIVLTALVREDDRVEAREAGADAYLIHPLYPQDLLMAVRDAVAARAHGERLRWNWPDLSGVARLAYEGASDRRRSR